MILLAFSFFNLTMREKVRTKVLYFLIVIGYARPPASRVLSSGIFLTIETDISKEVLSSYYDI
jgi:hypothetical protein